MKDKQEFLTKLMVSFSGIFLLVEGMLLVSDAYLMFKNDKEKVIEEED